MYVPFASSRLGYFLFEDVIASTCYAAVFVVVVVRFETIICI